MALTLHWRRMLRLAGIVVVALVIGLVALVVIQQHILRWRAERLLADIRALELGKSTWADAQTIMTRWGAWGFYEGSCTARRCTYQIDLEDAYGVFPVYSLSSQKLRKEPRRCCNWMLFPYGILGGRAAWASARVEVIDGFVWGKDFFLATLVSARFGSYEYPYTVSAMAKTVWRTGEFHQEVVPWHPEYVIGRPGGCEGCVAGYFRFTPFANPTKVDELMRFNLGCITRFFPCQDQMDVMPVAWKQYLKEEAAPVVEQNSGQETQERGGEMQFLPSPEFLGRDSANIVVTEVASTGARQESWGVECFTLFRLKERLKRATFWKDGGQTESGTPCAQAAVGEADSGKTLTVGKDVILAFDTPYGVMSQRFIDLKPNAIFPLTDDNLAAVRRGIGMDIFPDATVHFP